MKTSTLKTVSITVLACVVLGAAGIFLWSQYSAAPAKIDVSHGGTSATSSSPSGTATADVSTPQVVTQTFSENTSLYATQVEYPQLQGIANAGVEATVNDAVKASVFKEIASFHTENAAAPAAAGAGQQSTFNANFTTALVTDSFFSGVIAYSDFSAGAVQPDNYIISLNYDLTTGKPATLTQILQDLGPSSGYFARLGAYVRQDLIRQFGSDAEEVQLIDTGGSPTAANYQYFTLDSQGLNILFDPYQVGPYSAGSAQVSIPYATLMSQIIESAGGAASAGTASSSETGQWWLQ